MTYAQKILPFWPLLIPTGRTCRRHNQVVVLPVARAPWGPRCINGELWWFNPPKLSPCQYTGLTWAFQFYRGPRPILWKCPFGTLYKIKILTDTYIISPIKSQPASNPSMSSNPKTLQNCSAQLKLVQGISSKLASIKLGPSKMAWS